MDPHDQIHLVTGGAEEQGLDPSLDPQKRKFAIYLHLGMKRNEICALIPGLSPKQARIWEKDPEIQGVLARAALQEHERAAVLRMKLALAAEGYLEDLHDIGTDPDQPVSVRVGVLQDLLDREGTLAKKAAMPSGAGGDTISDEQLLRVLAVAREDDNGGKSSE